MGRAADLILLAPAKRAAVASATVARAAILTSLAPAVCAPPSAAQRRAAPPGTEGPHLPASNHFNQRVDSLAVAANSDTLTSSIGLDAKVHADFGSGSFDGGPIGIPFVVVGRAQRKVPSFRVHRRGRTAALPVPPSAPVEDGSKAAGDRHVLVVDKARCKLYELYAARPHAGGGRWSAGSGAIWNLRSNKLRPAGHTSADAAGLPILPSLAHYSEVAAGSIDHALRFTARRTRRAYVYRARHFASSDAAPRCRRWARGCA